MRALALVALAMTNIGVCDVKKPHQDIWLAVGGVHELTVNSCKLTKMEPAGALEDLKWEGDRQVMQAQAECTAEYECGGDRFTYHVVKPARLDVIVDGEPVKAGAHFQVRAVPRDASGRQLDIGKWTQVEWTSEGDVASDNDPSAGEFGLCDTCFGQQGFRASKAGTVKVRASFGGLTGEREVPVL